MVNESMLALGTKRSCIRELFEYGLKQAALVGRENVFDGCEIPDDGWNVR